MRGAGGKRERMLFDDRLTGGHPHGGNARQFKYMVRYGMTPMQAIQAATIVSAELLR
jgi:imidazolonepropionase-like amidohydrolase